MMMVTYEHVLRAIALILHWTDVSFNDTTTELTGLPPGETTRATLGWGTDDSQALLVLMAVCNALFGHTVLGRDGDAYHLGIDITEQFRVRVSLADRSHPPEQRIHGFQTVPCQTFGVAVFTLLHLMMEAGVWPAPQTAVRR